MERPEIHEYPSKDGSISRCYRWKGFCLDIIRITKSIIIIQYGSTKSKRINFISKVSKDCTREEYPKFLLSSSWKTTKKIKNIRIGKTTKPIQLLSRGQDVSRRRQPGAGKPNPRLVHGRRL